MFKIQFKIQKNLLFAFSLVALSGFSQVDFNNYRPLLSSGVIPDDFTKPTYQKISDDKGTKREDLNSKREKIFLEGIHYSIDGILHSGLVVYGDEVSKYVNQVANNLLKNRTDLQSKLRFYTLKSNETNAFSTDQGIVFVTTGLIAQLTSEAQLALVLAHEICHYTEKHVLESYNLKLESRNYSKRIQELSKYSKEKEFEADVKGLELYQAAGYPKSEILPTFDVLMYSYLPFDEIEFPKEYLNTENLFIPISKFPTEKFPIKAVEDEDDSKSSHPNIKRRKEKMQETISNYAQWGTNANPLSLERFQEIRMICRFESVRTDLNDLKFGDALYSIFLLEKDYPNSIYLQRMKAKTWLGIAQHRLENSLSKHLLKTSELEGEISTVHFFLKELKKEEVSTIALRIVYDLHKKFPNDREISAVYDRMIYTFASTDKIDVNSFSKMNYNEALNKFNSKEDTVKTTPEVKTELSKYEKIQSKKNVEDPNNFDESNYYLYALGDMIQQESFLKVYREKKEKIDEKKKKEDEWDALSNSEKKKARKQKNKEVLQIGESNLIVVEPIVYKIKKNEVDQIKSEKLAEVYIDAVKENAEDLDMNVTVLSTSTLVDQGTSAYNERAILFNYLGQISENDDIDVFPVDFDMLDEIKNNYGTDKVVFSLLEHRFEADDLGFAIVYGIFIPPILAISIPYILFNAPNTELNVVVMDLNKGQIVKANEYVFNNSLNKVSISAYVYEVLAQLKTQPK